MLTFAKYVVGFNLMKSLLAIVALLLAASAAHVTLFKWGDDFLKEVRMCTNKSKKRKRLEAANTAKWILIRVGGLGVTALVLTVVCWFSLQPAWF